MLEVERTGRKVSISSMRDALNAQSSDAWRPQKNTGVSDREGK